jgi:hypothetical protein
MVRRRYGSPHFSNGPNPESILFATRPVVKAGLDSVTETRIGITNTPENIDDERLHCQRFGD